MEKQEKSKQNGISFENLKKLSGIISGSELTTIVSNIQKSKVALETFCRNIKEHEAKLKKGEVKAKVSEQPKVAETVETKVEKPVNTDTSALNSEKKSFVIENKTNKENISFNKVQNKDKFNRS